MFREYSSLRAKSVGPALYEEMTLDRPGGGKATVIIKGQNFFFLIMAKQWILNDFLKKIQTKYILRHMDTIWAMKLGLSTLNFSDVESFCLFIFTNKWMNIHLFKMICELWHTSLSVSLCS